MNKFKIMIACVAGIFLLVLLNAATSQTQYNGAEKKCIEEAQEICRRYGVENPNIILERSGYDKKRRLYHLRILGKNTFANLDDLYHYVEEVEHVRVKSVGKSYTFTAVFLDGKRCEIDYYDNRNMAELKINGEMTYRYFSDEGRKKLERIRKRIPYEGMPEEYIDFSILGKPDREESNQSQRAALRRNRYQWHDEKGVLIGEAVISYYKDGSYASGYVESFELSDFYRFESGELKKIPVQWESYSYYDSRDDDEDDDYYHVNDYDDAEDFYDDYEDDFDGYEDAEDYYEEFHE